MIDPIYGFIYVSEQEQHPLSQVIIGQTYTLPENLNPLLIHYDISTIDIHQWPGQLFFVEVLDYVEKGTNLQEIDYISAVNIRLFKELTCSFLFGPQGGGVCQLLDKIQTLTLVQVEQLALLANPIRAEVYASIWDNWLKNNTNLAMHRDADHSVTLAIGKGEDASPIYSGLLTINDMVYKRARELSGEAAFITQHNSLSDVYLNTLWANACTVLLQAAMGLGAEQYASPQELELLLAGWELLANPS